MLIKFNVSSNKMSRSRCCNIIGSKALSQWQVMKFYWSYLRGLIVRLREGTLMEWIIHDSLLKGLSLSQTGIYIVCHTPCWCTIFVHKRMEHKENAGDFFFTSEGVDFSISWMFHKIELHRCV